MQQLMHFLRSNIVWLVAGFFVIGFADLLRGGITVSAIALTIAYCVLVPVWILRSREAPSPQGEVPERTAPILPAALAGGAVFLLYLATLSRGAAMWDASEYIAAAYTFGIPHPPGNPFFTIIGRFFTLLPIPVSIAARVNILAAVSSAVAATVWFLIAERALSTWMPHRWQRLTGGAVAALTGATAFTVWNQSVVNEKVYTLALAGMAIVSWLAIRWLENPRSQRSDQLLILIAYLCGLGYANHMAGMLAAPAVVLAVLLRDRQRLFRSRIVLACAGATLIGLTPFITQPIRSGFNPAINEGGVSACTTEFRLSCTFSRVTLDRFISNFNRDQYLKPSVMERQAPFTAQLGMWWLYFKWQWLRDPFLNSPGAQNFLAVSFFLLGVLGAYVHWKRDRLSFYYFGPLMFTMTLGLIFYLNFKYGHSQAPLLDGVPREVRDRDYFYLWSFSAWSVWVSVGLVALWGWLAEYARMIARGAESAGSAAVSPRHWLYASPVLLAAVIPFFTNFSAATRHDDNVTAAWARDLLNSVEPYGVLVVGGDNDTFPLWYAQEVEKVRRDVVVANTSLLNTDWHPRQLILRPIYEYDAERGPAIYRDRQWTKPTHPPLRISIAQADSFPERLPASSPVVFEANGITATIDPRQMEYGAIVKADIFVLQMIRDSWPGRPVYFSRSTGPYAQQLGVQGYMLSQGLVQKLYLPSPVDSLAPGTIKAAGEVIFDLTKLQALWNDIYTGHDELAKRGRWVDEPSVNIPLLYVVMGSELSHLLDLRGDSVASDSVFQKARSVAAATSVPGIVARLDASRIR